MRMTEAAWARWWAIGLALLTIVASLLIVRVNPLEIAITFLVLLAAIIEIGLMTNVWGGLAASAVGVFAIVLFGQYAGVYLREDRIANIAAELVALLLAGPLAGGLGAAIERLRREAGGWLARAEELTAHDETFGTLKPAWCKVRLEEEAMRAARFGRPLCLALVQLEPSHEEAARDRAARVAALQAVVRLARAITQPPVVIGHAGGDQVLLILPEHTVDQAQQVAEVLRRRARRELYFPDRRGNSLGRPLTEWGELRVGVAALAGRGETGEALLAQARAALVASYTGPDGYGGAVGGRIGAHQDPGGGPPE